MTTSIGQTFFLTVRYPYTVKDLQMTRFHEMDLICEVTGVDEHNVQWKLISLRAQRDIPPLTVARKPAPQTGGMSLAEFAKLTGK